MSNYKGIEIKNIFQMMAYVWSNNNFHCSKQSDFAIKVEENACISIENLLAYIVVQATIRHFKRGLYRSYLPATEELTLLRGRLNLPKTIKNEMRNRSSLFCDVDDFTENNIFNQILKTAIDKLLKIDKKHLSSDIRNLLKRCAFLLRDCCTLQKISWKSIDYNALNYTYKMTLCVCRWIIEYTHPDVDNGQMKFRLMDFENKELEHYFETFIANYYKYHFKNLKIKHGETIHWKFTENKTGDNTYLPKMKTDVILKNEESTLIIDAKFYGSLYQYNTQHIRPFHMYQIYSYINNYAETNVNGLLIYAKPEKDDFPERILRYNEGDKSFAVMALDLGIEFEKVKEQLNNVVEEYFSLQPTVK